MFTFIQPHISISLYNLLPEAFVVVYKHLSMTSVLELQSFVLIYGLLFELWVFNLNKEKEEEEKEEKKMKNSAHHRDGGEDLDHPYIHYHTL